MRKSPLISWSVSWGTQTEFDLAPHATGLPFAAEGESHRGAAKLYFVLALVFLVLAASATFHTYVPVAIAEGMFALWALAMGVHEWSLRQRWEFTETSVNCRTRSMLARRSWEEPLSAYAGVVSKRKRMGFRLEEDSDPGRKQLYVLMLDHRTNPGRSVKLYSSRSPHALWPNQTHYGKLLGLPGLIETRAGMVVRPAEDLGKSVRQRVAEGSLRVSFDPTTRPAGGVLQVRVEEDALVFRAGGCPWGIVGRVLPPALIFSGAVTSVLGLMLGPWSHAILTIVGAAQLALGVGTRLAFWLAPEELAVSVSGVSKRRRHPWGTFGELSIPADLIEEVAVREPAGNGKHTLVQVISHGATIRFGALLSDTEKNWVRVCIIAVVSK